jgi:hypothetical protein
VRYVGHADRRVAEANKFGLDPVVGPACDGLRGLAPCPTVRQALRAAFSESRDRVAA